MLPRPLGTLLARDPALSVARPDGDCTEQRTGASDGGKQEGGGYHRFTTWSMP